MNINRIPFVKFGNVNKPVNGNKQVDENKPKPEDDFKKAKHFPKDDVYTTQALGEEGGSRLPNISKS